MSIESEDLFGTDSLRPANSFTSDYNISVRIHKLPDHQIDELRALFPDKTIVTSNKIPSSGLPYLESLTDLAVDETFHRMLRLFTTPNIIYVAGECPQLANCYTDIIWNIETPGDDFGSAGTISSCTHQLSDLCECAGSPPDAYLFAHTLYYYSTVDIARALYNSRDRYAFSVHHSFKGAQGSLGFEEVNFEVSHGRVSTTRFPSFERSDLNWLYTRNKVELFQSAPGTNEALHLYERSPTRVLWTLSWKIVFESKDIQVVLFQLSEGAVNLKPPPLDEPTIESLKNGQLAYGHLRESTGLHVEQIWHQIVIYIEGEGKKVFSLDQLQEALKDGSSIPEALNKLRPRKHTGALSAL